MAWSVWACDTVTGDKLVRLPVASFSWERVLNAGGSGKASLKLKDKDVARLPLKAIMVEASTTLVLDWDGAVVYAGIITSQSYDPSTGTLDIDHSDLWWILQRRLAADFTVADTSAAQRTYTNLSLGTIAKRQVQLGITGPSNDNAVLPVTFQGDETASTGTRTFYGYHFTMVADALDSLNGETNGPDIDFSPRWVAGKLSWLMRAGTVASPSLVTGSFEWNLAAEKSGVSSLSLTRDANKMVTAAYALGEGQGVDMPYASNRIVDPLYPTLQRVEAYSHKATVQLLANQADADLQKLKRPTEQWSCSVRASGTPAVSALQLGGTAKFYTSGDPWMNDGWHNNRLIRFSGDLGENVALGFQPNRSV